jgi:peptidoglycan/LPS O-acetylase OafA/YrhL
MKSGYLPSLDGWRAVAILAVILFHDRSHDFGKFSGIMHQYGSYGVDVFFAISGILICSRLLQEEHDRGSISLRGFYIRRFFRILPAAWMFLLVYLLLALFRQLPMDSGGVTTAFLMIRNIWVQFAGDTADHWYTIHFWSLSVEEHFYLLLPGLIAFCPRARRGLVLGALSLACLVWTEIILHFGSLQPSGVWLRTDFRIGALLIPAFFAVQLREAAVKKWATQWLKPGLTAGLFGAACCLLCFIPAQRAAAAAAIILPAGLPLILIATMLHPAAVMTRIFELPPVRYAGHLSYSLYLWQQLFFSDAHTPAKWPLSLVQLFPWNYAAAAVCAAASYYLIERPFIRVGRRATRLAVPGHTAATAFAPVLPQHSAGAQQLQPEVV